MSYILEALKKAQAERQLSSAPTIHALPIQAGPTHAASATRTPLWIALGAFTLVAVAGAVWWWLQAPPAAVAPAPVQVVQQVAPAPAPQPAYVPPPPVPVVQAPAPGPIASVKPAPVAAPVAAAPPAHAEPAPPTYAAEDALPFARDLPEPLRSQLPQVTLGGYMYSKNPADRLILIDKSLRHEGEEVAPGLVLEKLMPKAAVMNYRGTRYRVAY
ncbi:MAG: general secretion pathway protein GspB [Pseudomonadota bacterium]